MNRAWRRKNAMPKTQMKHMLSPLDEYALDALVEDMADGMIFTNFSVPDARQIPLVFPVVTTLGRKNAEWFSQNVGLIYEELSNALPSLQPNALPRFNSMKALNREQGSYVIKKYNELMAYRQAPAAVPGAVPTPE